jgi:hypothetical protein
VRRTGDPKNHQTQINDMSNDLKKKLDTLESLYLKKSAEADKVPHLERKVAELKGEVASLSRRAITDDTAEAIADGLIGEGLLKLASRQEFVDVILDNPHEIADTVRKVASMAGGAVQIGRSGELSDSPVHTKTDPLTAYALS